ncbi:NAD(+) synthase [Butyrivibrio sp. AE2032]|uniref:NAD(+) synthase n=1 Tax=Butyrivibrio sp. AE2032 TaxID=1458463 RepID=UPI0005563FAC|nr:NAD(+) synthase [Butyrivibrio sp. AE2032]
MLDGFIRVAAASPKVRVGDVDHNISETVRLARKAASKDCAVIVFPELGLTGYTCGDLFLQKALLDKARNGLYDLANMTSDLNTVLIVGLPYELGGKLYNVAAVIHQGDIIGIVPKQNIPNYSEFYELRHFTPYTDDGIIMTEDDVCFGKAVFNCAGFYFAAEICEDLWVASSPSADYVKNGAQVIFNLSCSDEIIGKAKYRRDLVKMQSAKLMAAYVYCDAGLGESTQDLVFAGHNIIAENGKILAESKRFANDSDEDAILFADIDIERLEADRRRSNTFSSDVNGDSGIDIIEFDAEFPDIELERHISRTPFVPESTTDLAARCEDILNMQAAGLYTRLKAINCSKAVIGLSGGLDSTLALIVTIHAFDKLGLDRKGIIGVTMPGFGTTARTKNNSINIAEEYGCTLKEISISAAVTQHFKDIGHDMEDHSVTYENAQARERTQILMDLANQEGGLVIGTGDLSELALGWATYNGDHMSMYGVNCSIPKTLVRYLVSYESTRTAETSPALSAALADIVATPVSPELLPPTEDGKISQKTEETVGPYELHDFFLYYMIRFGFAPSKIYRMALIAFDGVYDADTIYKWEETFMRRFFSQQFKRSCVPDGPKVGTVTLSPRGDWRMPSDASRNVWLDDLKTVKE